MIKTTFDIIILTARPASGKSEVIDYLKKTDVETRKQRFHIGEFEEIDDFPYVWYNQTIEADDDFFEVPYGSPQAETLLTVTHDVGGNTGRNPARHPALSGQLHPLRR